MPSRNYDLMELVRKKASMSADIVIRKDAEYSEYAGASLEIASKMAFIYTFLEHNLLPDKIVPITKLYYSLLNHQRKAYFASVGSTEITMLGFIQGEPRPSASANETT